MTQTHLLIAAALFARPGGYRRNTAVLVGALIPDAAIYVLVVYAAINKIPRNTLWSETYWADSWQIWVTIGNSAPLYLCLLLAALVLAAPKDRRPRWQSLPALLAIAALTHLAGDLPLHNDDAHIHFWPLTDWRFHSPVSYWDLNHHAGVFAPLEMLLGLSLMGLLFRRFKGCATRIALGLAMTLYIAVPLFFIFAP